MPAAKTGTPMICRFSTARPTRSPHDATQSTDATVSCVRHGMPDTGNATTWSAIAARNSHGARRRISAKRPRLPPRARRGAPATTTARAGTPRGDATSEDDDLGQLLGADDAEPLEMSLQCRDDLRVELGPRIPLELLDGLLRSRCIAVAAIGRDRVVGVRDEDQPRPKGNLRAGETVRIARAVPVLVVVLDPDVDRADVHPVEKRRAELRVVCE